MRMFRRLFIVFALTAGSAFPVGAFAATVIIDFDGTTPGSLLTANYLEDGVTMERLSGHYDFFASGGSADTPYLGLDVAGTETLSKLRFSGGSFNLVSLDVMYAASEGIGENQILESSAGGLASLSTTGVQYFSGPDWSNLTWISLSSNVNIAGPGFDSITLETVVVPLPAAFLLFGSGLIALTGMARIRKPACRNKGAGIIS